MRMKRLALLLLLGACGPIPLEEAERQCTEQARLAQQPRGTIGAGLNSKGQTFGKFEVTVSSDYIMGRDPAEVYKSCVKSRSGQFPSRALQDQPGYRTKG